MAQNPDDDDENERPGCYASPPCFMHELDPLYLGSSPEPDAQQRPLVMRWRKAERERLLGLRATLSADERQARDSTIADALDALLSPVSGQTIAIYWPVRGEPDLRAWVADIAARRAVCVLPVALRCDAPLIFRPWHAGSELQPDALGVPAPVEGPEIAPDIIVAPLIGFDGARHRLGYGDGLLDRTLAAMAQKPRTIGVGYAESTLPTIYPQPHDIAFDFIVTDIADLPSRLQ